MVELVIVLGAVAGGFVSGLTGFGTGLTVLAVWLIVVPPLIASPLVVFCSIVAQIQTLPQIWRAIRWRKVAPFIAGGILGVPLGTRILPLVDADSFKAFVGCLLVAYCGLMLLRRSAPRLDWGGHWANGVVGLGGGILGGVAGLSGVLPSVWATFKHWPKDEMRSVFQTFNLTILTVAALSQAVQGVVTSEVVYLAAIALPGTMLGAWIGRRIYARLNDDRYNQIVLVLLLISGASLAASTVVIG